MDCERIKCENVRVINSFPLIIAEENVTEKQVEFKKILRILGLYVSSSVICGLGKKKLLKKVG